MMVTVSQIGWSRYHDREGPFFGGTIKVPITNRTDSFADRVLSLTAAAEGGHFNSINMYDSGLVSVGAIQFIDAGSLNVCNMLGAVVESCGLDKVLDSFRPALNVSNATFFRTSDNKWRFSVDGVTVNTNALQKKLYFGDERGNLVGSYDSTKRQHAKIWAACFASVWEVPGAVQAQVNFTLPKLINDFVWGQLKTDLFTGDQPENGWCGALRALLLAFAVNAPAIVVKRYAMHRDNPEPFGTPKWCLNVMRGIVIGAGIDVWPARWIAKRNLVERMFGVKLPTYQQLNAGDWNDVDLVVVSDVDAPSRKFEYEPLEQLPVIQDEFERPKRIVSDQNKIDVLTAIFGYFKVMVDIVVKALGRK
jgi:hypothetical protein